MQLIAAGIDPKTQKTNWEKFEMLSSTPISDFYGRCWKTSCFLVKKKVTAATISLWLLVGHHQGSNPRHKTIFDKFIQTNHLGKISTAADFDCFLQCRK